MGALRRTQLRLADGRDLNVFESGPPDGRVLLYHHGAPGSGVPFRAMVAAAHRLGLRLVTTSCPGYGDSTRQPGRSVADVAADLAFVKPWGFSFAKVTAPTLLRQGTADLMAPVGHGQWLAERIPGVVAHIQEGEGHLSIGIGSLDRMLQELVAAGSAQG